MTKFGEIGFEDVIEGVSLAGLETNDLTPQNVHPDALSKTRDRDGHGTTVSHNMTSASATD